MYIKNQIRFDIFLNFETNSFKKRVLVYNLTMKTMSTMKILLFFFVLSNLLFGQNLSVSVSPNPVTEGDKFRVEFSLNSSGNNFTPPSFSGFEVLQGPSVSNSTQIINGNFSQSISWTYILQANKKGSFFIAPASVSSNGKTIKSDRVKVDVLEPSEAEKQQRQQEKNSEQNLQDQAMKLIRDNLFVNVKINKSNAIVGEQVIATYTLYYHPELNIVQLNYDKKPIFNGFWAQEIDLGKSNKWEVENINGVPFRKIDVLKVILYPQQSGNLTLEPMAFNSVVRLQVSGGRRSNSIFDNFFSRNSYRDFEYKVKSKTLSVNVKELPEPRPLDFSGAVGDLKFESWLDKNKTLTGEPITLKVKVSGNGNLKLLNAPELKFPTGFEVYDPKVVDNSSVSLAGTSGNIQFEYLIIPRNPGEFKLGPVELSYFDLTSKQYKKFKSEEYLVTVGKGNGTQSTSVNFAGKENVKYIGKDIRYLKEDLDSSSSGFWFLSTTHVLSILSLINLTLLVFFLVKKKEDDESDVQGFKLRKANKVAKKRLAEAKKCLDSNQKEKFYEEVYKAIFGYLSDKLTISMSDLNKDIIKQRLEAKKVSNEIINKVVKTIDACEYVRYAPSMAEDNISSIYNEVSDVIAKLEDTL